MSKDLVEIFSTRSIRATTALGSELAARLRPGDCVALIGELGAGKTAMVRGIALGLGLTDDKLVSSPTFVLVQEYPCRLKVFHIDLYRISGSPGELDSLGLREMLQAGVALVEWADRAGENLPRPRWQIEIFHTGPTSRRFEVKRIE